MRGAIDYAGSALPVPVVTVVVLAPTPSSVQTDGTGRFRFDGVGTDSVAIQPQKRGDGAGAITAMDAVFALQAARGRRVLTVEQQLACGVRGDGTVSTLDASLILQYRVGRIASFPVAQVCDSDWAFIPNSAPRAGQQLIQPSTAPGTCQPGAITWTPLSGSVDDRDFTALFFGDCDGSWPAGPSPTLQLHSAQIRLGRARTAKQRVFVPVSVETAAAYYALDLDLRYDPAQLTPMGVQRVGGARQALVEAYVRAPGRLAVALASSEPLASGAVLALQLDTAYGARVPLHVDRAAVDGATR